ncbi:hypothetical protein C8R41DRAFT_528764 [Lentinula lateritia]|uniref:Uncharacterized protein n=1 Tax=Lentinula lateritia TaxID=40482 RepID=A0ABQ8VUS1_9AGAR|nr:hypothetical protein C8R41DRAFT_528764 [Lentinula lateritia]
MRIGIPDRLLSKDYDTFMASFNGRLHTGRPLLGAVESTLTGSRSYLLTLFLYTVLAIEVEILPEHVREEYMLVFFRTWYSRVFQRCIVWLCWVIYPMSALFPPVRVALCFLLLLDPSAWPSFLESCREMLSIDPIEGTPTLEPGDTDSALRWLALNSGPCGKSLLQTALVLLLDTQHQSQKARGTNKILPWMTLIPQSIKLVLTTFYCGVRNVVEDVCMLIHARRMLQMNIKGPKHSMS